MLNLFLDENLISVENILCSPASPINLTPLVCLREGKALAGQNWLSGDQLCWSAKDQNIGLWEMQWRRSEDFIISSTESHIYWFKNLLTRLLAKFYRSCDQFYFDCQHLGTIQKNNSMEAFENWTTHFIEVFDQKMQCGFSHVAIYISNIECITGVLLIN